MKTIAKADEGGFSLAELLVAITIMGILMAMILPLMMRGTSSNMKDNLRLLSKNSEEWSVKNPSLTLQGTQGMIKSSGFAYDVSAKNSGLVLPEYFNDFGDRSNLGLVYVTDTEYLICYDKNPRTPEVLVYDPFNDSFTEYETGCHR